MNICKSIDAGLAWHIPSAGRWLYDYSHRRTVRCQSLLLESTDIAERVADLIFVAGSTPEQIRVTMTNIRDTGLFSGEPIAQPLSTRRLPVMVFDRVGRIVENASPEITPLHFIPELQDLEPGQTRRTRYAAKLRSGFGRTEVQGTVNTTWEETERWGQGLCAVLVTTFELTGAPGGWPWSPPPPRYSGRTVVHFDLEQGRLALLAGTSRVEQTVNWTRCTQDQEMTLRFVAAT